VCGGKTFYDTALDYADYETCDEHGIALPRGCGSWAVLCPKCAKTHEARIVSRAAPRELDSSGGSLPPDASEVVADAVLVRIDNDGSADLHVFVLRDESIVPLNAVGIPVRLMRYDPLLQRDKEGT
jgi:hypothetical protein